MDSRLLDILRCPVSKGAVRALRRDELDALNRAIAADGLATADGQVRRQPLQAGLLAADGQRVYRIDDGIPVMLADQAIPVAGVAGFVAG
ncbi:Trm112 family protein [Dokdonella koreensis]|uniref:Trm112 family protein n=1 Tax=Dokdonella koreensis DS-123 TaxID=1300342 RepID=A0A167H6Z5_9GAMM|nr:hypothetical protein [Dokdonella koreensis]ANB19236.1 Hypothetical protein I596_3247 [Dokdonella koreensis DS-123]